MQIRLLLLLAFSLLPRSATAQRNARVASIEIGPSAICAVMSTGAVRCFGHGAYGQLGDGLRTDNAAVVSVTNIADATQVELGEGHACALRRGGTVQCWGYGGYGQVGNGASENQTTPVDVSGLSGVTDLSASYYSTCALVAEGHVKCWGSNTFGESGQAEGTSQFTTPVEITNLANVVEIDGGQNFHCGRLNDGTVRCWGYFGPAHNPVPQAVPELAGATAIAIEGSTACALTRQGVRCFDGHGPPEPIAVENAQAIAAGYRNGCALVRGGSVMCWGEEYEDWLGNGAGNAPSAVPGVARATSLWVGSMATCVAVGNQVRCWGRVSAPGGGGTQAWSAATPTAVSF